MKNNLKPLDVAQCQEVSDRACRSIMCQDTRDCDKLDNTEAFKQDSLPVICHVFESSLELCFADWATCKRAQCVHQAQAFHCCNGNMAACSNLLTSDKAHIACALSCMMTVTNECCQLARS